ncbi:MAG: hypothetical protein ACE5KA_08895 [Nitrososphaerales archaeon]
MGEEIVTKNKATAKYKIFDIFFVYAYHRIVQPSSDETGDADDILNSFMFLFGTSKAAARNYLNALLSSEGYFYIKEYDTYDASHGHLMVRPSKGETASKAYKRMLADREFLDFMERNVSPLARRGNVIPG